jgi:hypothetical protein
VQENACFKKIVYTVYCKFGGTPLLPEAEIIQKLLEMTEFAPFNVTSVDPRDRSSEERKSRPFATLDLEWRGRRRRFVAQCKELSTPKFIEAAAEEARGFARGDFLPLVIVPYLSPEALKRLESMEVSGLDLCGNGVVVIPGEWLVVRTGAGNQFPTSAPIKNVFRGTSSLVSRVFLSRPEYDSVTEVQDEVRRRGGQVHISTVSKVLHALEEELIIARTRETIRLVNPERLLNLLAENYRPPEIGRCICVRVPEVIAFLAKLSTIAEESGIGVAADTLSRHILQSTARDKKVALPRVVYVSSLKVFDEIIPAPIKERGENIELHEIDDPTIFFDPRQESCFPWTSILQAYLELTQTENTGSRELVRKMRDKITNRIL